MPNTFVSRKRFFVFFLSEDKYAYFLRKQNTSGSVADELLVQLGTWKEKSPFTKVKDKWIGVIFFIFVLCLIRKLGRQQNWVSLTFVWSEFSQWGNITRNYWGNCDQICKHQKCKGQAIFKEENICKKIRQRVSESSYNTKTSPNYINPFMKVKVKVSFLFSKLARKKILIPFSSVTHPFVSGKGVEK